MARSRHAPTETRTASLASEFGYAYAVRLFGQDTVDSLPVLKAGKNKGKPKAHVIWLKTREAGYHPCVGTGVAAGTTVRAWLSANPYAQESMALCAMWLGRVQPVCGSRSLLGAANRERWMQTERNAAAAREQEMAESKAEMAAMRAAARLLGA